MKTVNGDRKRHGLSSYSRQTNRFAPDQVAKRMFHQACGSLSE
jgi:hypothetical protein